MTNLLQYSWQSKAQKKSALTALFCTVAVAIPLPHVSYNVTVESVAGKITGAVLMFVIVFLTGHFTKERIVRSITNIKLITIIFPVILLFFMGIGALKLNFVAQLLFAVIFFNSIYFSRLSKN